MKLHITLRGANDMGHFTIRDDDYYWKIDCCDRNPEYHAPDPADPSITIGVLTNMRVDEY